MPLLGWYVAHVATVSLGVARAALDEATEGAQKRVPTFTMAPLADQPTAQLELARAEAKLCSARLLLREAIADLWRAVSALPPKQRSAVVLRYATDMSYSAIARAMDSSEAAARRNVHEGVKKMREALA